LQPDECDETVGWRPNFILYEGSHQSNDTIQLYNYENNRPARASSNLFLRNDVNQSHLSFAQGQGLFFIPGKRAMLKIKS